MVVEEARYYRDTWVEVDLKCIFENVRNMKAHLPEDTNIMAVVKANGYGHGALPVAKTAIEAGSSSLAVATLDEAIELRRHGMIVPILVLGWIRPQDVAVAGEHNITITIFQLEWLQQAIEFLPNHLKIDFHLKVDTGMGRIGAKEKNEVDGIIHFIKKQPQFNMTGIFTHFATADELDLSYFQKQYNRFLTMLDWLKEKEIKVEIIHCANSATALRFPTKVFNAVRFGISMYGLTPSLEIKDRLPFQLQEAFSLKSKIIHVKKIEAGERISYGGTYQSQKNEWIGTVPIGYADGWIRKLKSSVVLVEGERCPIVGRICMDQMMIRLPKEVSIGSEVTLIGRQYNEEISIDEVAKLLETINYEIPCMITARVPRIYV